MKGDTFMEKWKKILFVGLSVFLFISGIVFISVSASLKYKQESKLAEISVTNDQISGIRLVPPSANSQPEFYLGTKIRKKENVVYIDPYIMPLYERPLFERLANQKWVNDQLISNSTAVSNKEYAFLIEGDFTHVNQVYLNEKLIWDNYEQK